MTDILGIDWSWQDPKKSQVDHWGHTEQFNEAMRIVCMQKLQDRISETSSSLNDVLSQSD